MTDDTSRNPKIIIDEDWKSTARQEKEVAQELRDSKEESDQAQAPPPASFSVLVTTLATQIMVALGQFPSPDGGEKKAEPAIARHLIDTLAMLEEKTKGNLTDEETGMLTQVLHELRMLYVATEKAQAEAPAS